MSKFARLLKTFLASPACLAFTLGFAHAALPGHPVIADAVAAVSQRRHLPLPSTDELARIVSATMTLFEKSVARRDMTELYEGAALPVRQQLSPELLLLSFRPFLTLSATLAPVSGTTPVISSMAVSPTEGALGLEGYYVLDRHTLTFRATFVREGLIWRWSNLHIKLLPAEAKPGT